MQNCSKLFKILSIKLFSFTKIRKAIYFRNMFFTFILIVILIKFLANDVSIFTKVHPTNVKQIHSNPLSQAQKIMSTLACLVTNRLLLKCLPLKV